MANELATLNSYLTARKGALREVMPKHLSPERVLRVALAAASRNPRLLQCTPESIYLSLHTSSQLGLEAGSPLGHAHLVPYKNGRTGRYECQFQPGYQGLVALARRSGELLSIYAYEVRDGDVFDWQLGDDPSIKHRPSSDPDRSKREITHVYAVAKLKDGGVQREVMMRSEIDAIMARSKAKNDGPWITDFAAMAKKTVIKRLCKLLPCSIELATAIESDNAVEAGDDPLSFMKPAEGEVVEEPAPVQTKTTSLKQKLQGNPPARAVETSLPPRDDGDTAPEDDLSPPESLKGLESDLNLEEEPAEKDDDEIAKPRSHRAEVLEMAADEIAGANMLELRERLKLTCEVLSADAIGQLVAQCGAKKEDIPKSKKLMRDFIVYAKEAFGS